MVVYVMIYIYRVYILYILWQVLIRYVVLIKSSINTNLSVVYLSIHSFMHFPIVKQASK